MMRYFKCISWYLKWCGDFDAFNLKCQMLLVKRQAVNNRKLLQSYHLKVKISITNSSSPKVTNLVDKKEKNSVFPGDL
jgi:hypothetical protein